MKPSKTPRSGPRPMRLLLLALALSLPACATKLQAPQACPAIPAPPPLTEPLPSESYSETARKNIQMWREQQMRTRTTP